MTRTRRPRASSSQVTLDDEDVADDCPICLHPYTRITSVPLCSHRFCFDCILRWTDQSRKCPLCNQTIGDYLLCGRTKHFLSRAPGLLPLRSVQRRRPPSRTTIWGPRSAVLSEQDRVQQAIERRRSIYQRNLYAKRVSSNVSRPYPTPEQFSELPELVARTTAFLRRELRIWPHLDVEWLSTFIISFMKSVDIRSEHAIEYLVEFLDVDGERRNTLHFVHEVYMFVCSPFQNLFMYDAAVQYDESDKTDKWTYHTARNLVHPYRCSDGRRGI
ncbi:hypothetical protein BDZ89DRAFT_1009489 [Hymenopellis radicata]|nr:hypothetical protein BDZ89DRAFT_1009489 [Hymenopellis radicata]